MELVFRKSRWVNTHWYILSSMLILGGTIIYSTAEILIAGLLFAIAITITLICEITRFYERAALMDKEIHYERGIVARHQIKIQYHSITNISVRQGVWQRLMGYGDVLIDTPGGSGYEITLHSFAKAPKIEKFIQQKLSSEHTRKR